MTPLTRKRVQSVKRYRFSLKVFESKLELHAGVEESAGGGVAGQVVSGEDAVHGQTASDEQPQVAGHVEAQAASGFEAQRAGLHAGGVDEVAALVLVEDVLAGEQLPADAG